MWEQWQSGLLNADTRVLGGDGTAPKIRGTISTIR
jgi:hypothetical protein